MHVARTGNHHIIWEMGLAEGLREAKTVVHELVFSLRTSSLLGPALGTTDVNIIGAGLITGKMNVYCRMGLVI